MKCRTLTRLAAVLVMAGFVALGTVGCRPTGPESAQAVPITVAMIEEAQSAWCEGLVAIGRVHSEGGDGRAEAAKVIDRLYNYAAGPVLFKPTLAHGAQTFRNTKEGALAYFAGGDPVYPDDNGFALKPWVAARFQNTATFIDGDVALVQGNVWVRDAEGNEVMVDKTFGYHRGPDGKLRIVLHHSSLPFAP